MSIAHPVHPSALNDSRSPGTSVAHGVRRGIRPALRRWIAVAMLMVASLIAVLYVANAIAVDDLMVDITSLEREREAVLRDNEALRAELLRLMSVDRITAIAAEQLGMQMPARPPRFIPSNGEPVETGANPASRSGR